MQSKYRPDKMLEELFAKWLDKHLYEVLKSEGRLTSFERADDEARQRLGEDIIVKKGSETYIIDEKATLHYINKNIPTFAFELYNRNSGAQGWLFNPNYKTTHYLLAWPRANNPFSINDPEDFSGADVMLY